MKKGRQDRIAETLTLCSKKQLDFLLIYYAYHYRDKNLSYL